jgi:hypothetical protein
MLKRAVAFGLALACAAVIAPRAVAADPSCKPVVGSFEAHIVPPPDCAAVLCTAGRVWGGLQGTYAFAMPTPPQPAGTVPTIFFFTGDSTVTLKNGQVVAGKDTGSLDFGPDGGFASLITFPDPANPGATLGQIRLRGQLDQVEGTTSGDYVGTFCR